MGEDLSGADEDFATTPEITAAYDLVARAYLDAFGDELAGKPEDRRLLGIVAERGGLVADVGSGPGHVSTFLRNRGAVVVAVDAAVAMAAVARDAGHPAAGADMRHLPFAGGSLDAVVAFYSLIHLPRPDIGVALAEFARCVTPGGLVLLAVHEGGGITGASEFLGRSVRLTATLFGLDELREAVIDAGLEIVESFQRPPYGDERTQRIYVLAQRGR